MKKRTRVIMLPSKEGVLSKGGNSGLHTKLEFGDRQHLCFINDEEIKEGDHVYHTQMFNHIGFTGIARVGKQRSNEDFECTSLDGEHTYYTTKEPKVIATTNPELHYKGVFNEQLKRKTFADVPQIPQAFIEEYCHKGGIDEVDVEYEIEDVSLEVFKRKGGETYIPKVNPNNCIIIHSIKESWMREEVQNLVIQALMARHNEGGDFRMQDWIKENL